MQQILRHSLPTTAAVLLLSGCMSMDRLEQAPTEIVQSHNTAFAGLRFPSSAPARNVVAPRGAPSDRYAVLALSGGGPDGAYGAGLLAGWSASGTRPQFDVVTGVSTGALMAPFAFLGPAYDGRLRELYTGEHIRTILSQGSALRLLRGPAMYRNDRLRQLIAQHVDDSLLRLIAAEHKTGRRLYIATANIDAQHMVIWNMGAIAAQGTTESAARFRQILLAAASVPVAFDPVLFSTHGSPLATGEAHMDATLFSHFYAGPELFPETCLTGVRVCTLHIIVHNRTVAEPQTIKFKASALIRRALETTIKANLNTRILATAQMATARGIAFRLAYLDIPFASVSPIDFDLAYMRSIYLLGEKAGTRPETWLAEPPRG
jgi:predicted acylesterase/phospholipase RssA